MRLMRGLVGIVLVTACVAALSGCSRANAGSATEDDFAQFMADTDGVTGTGGFVSNNLPFFGSGDLEVELDATRDEQVLEQAVQRATEFDVPAGVTLYTLGVRVTSPGDGAEGEPRPGILIENLWGTPPGDLAARAAVLSRLDGLIDYSETLDDAHGHDADARTIRALIDSASGDVCEHLTSIAEAAHVSEDEIVASASSGSPVRCG